MSNQTDLYRARAELDRIRQEEEEKARAERQKAQRKVALEREIAAGEHQQRQEQLRQAAARNTELIAANQQAIAQAMNYLDSIVSLVNGVSLDKNEVDATFQEQQRYAENAVAMVATAGAEMPFLGRDHSNLTWEQQQQVDTWKTQRNQAIAQAEAMFPPALPLWAGLRQWVSEGKTDDERAQRSRLVYLVTGDQVEVGANYNAQAEVKQVIRQRRRGY